MSEHNTEIRRPARVIVVDAENPLQEIRGEFVWFEDHERAVALARDAAFTEGWEAAQSHMAAVPVNIEVQRRRSAFHFGLTAALILVVLLVVLMMPVVLG